MSEDKRPWPTDVWRVEDYPYFHLRSESGCILARDYVHPGVENLIINSPKMAELIKFYADKGDKQAIALWKEITTMVKT